MRIRDFIPAVWLVAAVSVAPVCYALEEAGPSDKIGLRILYAGDPGSTREKDFVNFLSKHFGEVKSVVLWSLEEDIPTDFDVAILDYDTERPGPCPILPREYSRATLTVGVMGSEICGSLNLKPGYL